MPCNRVQGLPALWEPSYKENKDLHKSDATISSYTEWAQSIFDHLKRRNRGWPHVLRLIEQKQKCVLYEELSKQHVGGVDSWDIACNLETFLATWISKTLKQRRSAPCGNQTSNGLDMWRQLHREFKGTGELIEASGRLFLKDFPKC